MSSLQSVYAQSGSTADWLRRTRALRGDVPQRFGHRFRRVGRGTGPMMSAILLAADLPTGHEGEICLVPGDSGWYDSMTRSETM